MCLYHKEGNFALYQGDCLKEIERFPENYFDMIFADPPYFLSGGSFTCQNGKMVSVKKGDWDLSRGLESDFDFHDKWINACRRVLKPGGTIWISGTYHSIYQCGYILQNAKFHILNDIVWFKPNASPNLSCRFFTASHETLIWARKEKAAKHTFNYDVMKDWEDNYTAEVECKKCRNQSRHEILHKQGQQMRSVWAINTPKKEEKQFGKHPTQKPLDLLKRIILASTKIGDVVLDPFAGSSTTGVAANLNNRKFVGIDLEKDYLYVSLKRLKVLV